jgi:hypothetical protein
MRAQKKTNRTIVCVKKKRLPHTRGLKNYIEEKTKNENRTDSSLFVPMRNIKKRRKKVKKKKRKDNNALPIKKNGQYSIIVI